MCVHQINRPTGASHPRHEKNENEGHKFIDSCHRFNDDAAADCAERSSRSTTHPPSRKNCYAQLRRHLSTPIPNPLTWMQRHCNVHRRAESPCTGTRRGEISAAGNPIMRRTRFPIVCRPGPSACAYVCRNLYPELIVSDVRAHARTRTLGSGPDSQHDARKYPEQRCQPCQRAEPTRAHTHSMQNAGAPASSLAPAQLCDCQ